MISILPRFRLPTDQAPASLRWSATDKAYTTSLESRPNESVTSVTNVGQLAPPPVFFSCSPADESGLQTRVRSSAELVGSICRRTVTLSPPPGQ